MVIFMMILTDPDSELEDILADYLHDNQYTWYNPESGWFEVVDADSRLWIRLLKHGLEQDRDFWW